METRMSILSTFEPGSRREGLAATAPLLVGVLASLVHYLHLTLPQWLEIVMAFGFFGLFVIPLLLMFVLGLIQGLPRWFLPYVGWVGSFFSLILASGLFLRMGVLHPSDPWVIRAVYGAGVPWFGLVGMTALTVLIAAVWKPLRPFYLRIQDDWTLLSFGLYGAAMMALSLVFDDYSNEEPYVIVASLILAAGAWVYLRSTRPWQRSLALLTGVTLAMAVAAIGKGILYSSPDWPYPRAITWQTEVLSTVFGWAWLAIVILAPSLLVLLPRPTEPLQPE